MPQVPLTVGEVSKILGRSFPTNAHWTISSCSFHQHSRLLIAHSTPNSNCSFPSRTETAHDVAMVQGRFREVSKKFKERSWATNIAACSFHPLTFRGSEWEIMVQMHYLSTSECWGGVQSPGTKFSYKCMLE